MCAILLPPDDRLELALCESEESELRSKRGKTLVESTYEGGRKGASSTGAE